MNNFAALLNSNDYQWGYTENPIPLSFSAFNQWQESGLAGPLKYLSDQRAGLRQDLRFIDPAFKSALVFLFPFADEVRTLHSLYAHPQWNGLKMAGYAFSFAGLDYHKVISQRLELIGKSLQQAIPGLSMRLAVDTLPILERDLAYRSGLGFYGINSMLINQQYGSFFMIGALLLDHVLPLDPLAVMQRDCGKCGKCAPACPSQAIASFTIDAGRCYSTFSIETFKQAAPPVQFKEQQRFFGCDICQEVCPWNKKVLQQAVVRPLSEAQQLLANFWLLRPVGEIIEELQSMSNSAYQKRFAPTSLARTGRMGLLKNLLALS